MKINSFSPIPEDDEELPLPELIYWASLGDLEQVKQLLIDGEDPNQNDDEGYSALQAAAENDHLEIVKLLVEKGAHVTYKSEYTALQLAEMAGNTDIVNYLKVYKIKSPFYLKGGFCSIKTNDISVVSQQLIEVLLLQIHWLQTFHLYCV